MTPLKQISETEKEEMKKKLKQTIEDKKEERIVWFPTCNLCNTDKKCEHIGDREKDARTCNDFEPDEKFGGVFVYKNKKKEKVYFRTVMGIVYASKEKSENPIWSFPLKNLHKTSTIRQLKSKSLTYLKPKDVGELVSKISLYIQQLRVLKKHVEPDLTAYLIVRPLTEVEISMYKEKAMLWLKDPKLLYKIKKALDIRIKRETKNKLLVFCAAHSAVLKDNIDRLHILSEGPSAVGKSHIMTYVLILFPRVLDFTRISPRALDWAQVDFTGWILYIRQRRRSKKDADEYFSLNMLVSEGKLTLYVAQKDPISGKMGTIGVVTKGVPCVQSTGTDEVVRDQDLTRVLDIKPDSSSGKIEEVVLNQWVQAGKIVKPKFHKDEMIVRVINELMTPIDVVIPYGKKIARFIPKDKVRVQRDNQKLIAVIKTIASLYRYQRLKITSKGHPSIVVANLDDLYYALLIAGGIIGESMTGLQKRILYFHEKLKQKFPQGDYEGFTSKDTSKATGHALKTCQKYLKELCDTGHLESVETKKPYEYFFSKKIIIPQLTEILNKIGRRIFQTSRQVG